MNLEELPPPDDPQTLFSVAGKTALVTGATTGIGLMIARTLLLHGAKVYLHGRREALCVEVAAKLSALGQCVPLAADLDQIHAGVEFAPRLVIAVSEGLSVLGGEQAASGKRTSGRRERGSGRG